MLRWLHAVSIQAQRKVGCGQKEVTCACRLDIDGVMAEDHEHTCACGAV